MGEAAAAEAAVTQYLTFRLAGEECGIELLQVREILPYATPTKVPGVPVAIRGVINVRGRVMPIIDLAVRFGLPAGEVTRQTCIMIVEVARADEPLVMGMVADAVSEVLELAPHQIEQEPSAGVKVDLAFLKGLGRIGERVVLLLDTDRVLTSGELSTAATLEPSGAAGEAGPR